MCIKKSPYSSLKVTRTRQKKLIEVKEKLQIWTKEHRGRQKIRSRELNFSKMSHKRPWGLWLMVKSEKSQEKPLEVQFHSQDIFTVYVTTKLSLYRYIKLSKSRKSRTKRSFTNFSFGTKDNLWCNNKNKSWNSRHASRHQAHRKRFRSLLDRLCNLFPLGYPIHCLLSTMEKRNRFYIINC
jgi:hypothetical protein